MSDNQKIDPSQALAIKHRVYLANIKSKALQQPSIYFSMRMKVLEEIEQKMCERTYEMFYDLLKNGKLETKAISVVDGATNFTLPPPEVPVQKINEIALQVANNISLALEDAINIILPENFDKIVESKMSLKSAGAHIDA